VGFSNVSTARTRRLHARSFYAYVFARSFPDIEVMNACLSGTHASTSVCSSSNKPEPGYRRITNGRRETSIPNTNMRCGEGPFQRAVAIIVRFVTHLRMWKHQIQIAFVCLPFWQLPDCYRVEERKTGRGEEYYISRPQRQTPYRRSVGQFVASNSSSPGHIIRMSQSSTQSAPGPELCSCIASLDAFWRAHSHDFQNLRFEVQKKAHESHAYMNFWFS